MDWDKIKKAVGIQSKENRKNIEDTRREALEKKTRSN